MLALTLPSLILSGVSIDVFGTSTSLRLILPGETGSVIVCSKKSYKSLLASRRLYITLASLDRGIRIAGDESFDFRLEQWT